MNASDVLAAVRAVVEAGEKATPGEWPAAKWVNIDGPGGWAAIGPHHTGEDDDTDEPGSPSDELATLDATFIAAASAARPALAAIVAAFDTPLAWREEGGDVVVPHEDGSEEGFYAGETATKVVLAVNTLAAIASGEVVCVSRETLRLVVEAARDGYGHHCGACPKCAALAEAEGVARV